MSALETTFEHSNEYDQLVNENKALREEIKNLKAENQYLSEQLQWFKKHLFGRRSEKSQENSSDDDYIYPPDWPFNTNKGNEDSSNNDDQSTTRKKRKKKYNRSGQHKITLPPDTPVVRQVLDIKEEDKICKKTGRKLIKIGEEITRKYIHVPGKWIIKEIVRPKYAYPKESTDPTNNENNQQQNDQYDTEVISAPLPESLLDRCQADESLLAEVLVRKYADHLPLYRISEIFARDGVEISRQLLDQWVVRCGMALKPLYEEMHRQILRSNNVFIDETPVKLLAPGKGKTHQAYMWLLAGGRSIQIPYRMYFFFKDRKHEHAQEIIPGYSGVVHSDKYGAYETLAKNEQIIWCPCWSHIRRYFLESQMGNLELVKWILTRIRWLYSYERVACARDEDSRLLIRQTKEAPILDEIIARVKNEIALNNFLPKSKYGKALNYFSGCIPYLKNYLYHPYARIDNNVGERTARPIAMGRKNWLFVGSERGGEAATVILSLIQTCRELHINPRLYLEDVMRRLMSHNARRLFELLPYQWSKSNCI